MLEITENKCLPWSLNCIGGIEDICSHETRPHVNLLLMLRDALCDKTWRWFQGLLAASLNINTGNFSFKPIWAFTNVHEIPNIFYSRMFWLRCYIHLFLCVEGFLKILIICNSLFTLVTSPPRNRWTLKMAANSCGPLERNFTAEKTC